jgi:hypothetical protein
LVDADLKLLSWPGNSTYGSTGSYAYRTDDGNKSTMVVVHLMEAQLPLVMLLALLTTVTMAHCTFQKTAPGKTQATQLAARQRLAGLD